jgi:hypothetical protein
MFFLEKKYYAINETQGNTYCILLILVSEKNRYPTYFKFLLQKYHIENFQFYKQLHTTLKFYETLKEMWFLYYLYVKISFMVIFSYFLLV